jgi:hydrophobe/amphiphile efflux-3 (HAE3) family protein
VNSGRFFGRLADWAVAHARQLLFASALVAIGAAIGATQLPTDTGTDTLVDSSSSSAKATDQFHREFGDDAVEVLVQGDLRKLVLTANLGRLLRLEGCLSGQIPKGAKPLPGACRELARTQPAKVVYGPATFLNQAVIGIESALGGQVSQTRVEAKRAGQLAARRSAAQGQSAAAQKAAAVAAEKEVASQFTARLLQVAANYGITHLPRIDDPLFVSQVVFDTRLPPGTPKGRFAYLFPSRHAALISIRLRPGLSDSERHRALQLIREAVFDTTPRQACSITKGQKQVPAPCFTLDGGHYVVTGAPIVVDSLGAVLTDTLIVLLAAAVLVMAATLALVFRTRLRLLPLGLALGTAAVTFGLFGLVGGSLTIASIAVLPVLIGLAVDYAIQLQARFDEALAAGRSGAEAARLAARTAGPVIGTACLATGAGFLVLLLSPVPMVRTFGLILLVGIGIAFFAALTVGFAALALSSERTAAGRPRLLPETPERLGPALARLSDLRVRAAAGISHAGKTALAVAIQSPGRVLAAAALMAVCGWLVAPRVPDQTDFTKLVPQGSSQIHDLKTLQDATGVSGELDVLVHAPDITDPRVIQWMSAFKQRVLQHNGFKGTYPRCRKARICPGTALSDFFVNPSEGLTKAGVSGLINAIPAYDSQAVITRGPGGVGFGNTSNISFGIRTMPLSQQQQLIDGIRSEVDLPGPGNGPPPGVTVSLAGLPVLAAESESDLSSSRYWLTLAGLGAVALALLAAYRSLSRALVPLIPIVLATGWSSLVVFAMHIKLNPMSGTLGALVIAIATEFSVILAARYREEREAGGSVGDALRRSYGRTGAAVLASGITVMAGFATLCVTVLPLLGSYDFPMIRNFGFVTVVDLGVALLGVMLVLPAVLVWAETGWEIGGVPLPRRLAALRR